MKVLLLVLVLTLTVAACSTSSDAEPSIRPLGDPDATRPAPPTTTSAPTTTTTEPDPWARPANPDAAYFERVLNELEEINIVAFRRIRDGEALTAEIESILRATKTGLNLEFELDMAARFAEEFPADITLEQAPAVSDAVLVEFTDQCALVETTISFHRVRDFETEGGRYLNSLSAVDPADLNSTGWAIEQRWSIENAPELSCTD